MSLESVRKALTSEPFIEKLALLLVAIILLGLINPIIIWYIIQESSKSQRESDATKARNEAIVQAQAKLLDELSETILTYEVLALDVSYKYSAAKDAEMAELAFRRYSESTAALVAKWRVLAIKAKILAKPAASKKIDDFLLRAFEKQDVPMSRLHRASSPDLAWQQQHQTNIELFTEANGLISELATELDLNPGSPVRQAGINLAQ